MGRRPLTGYPGCGQRPPTGCRPLGRGAVCPRDCQERPGHGGGQKRLCSRPFSLWSCRGTAEEASGWVRPESAALLSHGQDWAGALRAAPPGRAPVPTAAPRAWGAEADTGQWVGDTLTHRYTHEHTPTHTCTRVHRYTCICTRRYIRAHRYTEVHMHTDTHTPIYTRMDTHTHAYTDIHT